MRSSIGALMSPCCVGSTRSMHQATRGVGFAAFALSVSAPSRRTKESGSSPLSKRITLALSPAVSHASRQRAVASSPAESPSNAMTTSRA